MVTRRRIVWASIGVVVALTLAGLAYFQPWKLWVDETVDEPVPVAATVPAGPAPKPSGSVASRGSSGTPTAAERQAAADLYRGQFVSHEHRTTGSVRILRLADGTRYLRLENLRTSNGPDVHVWLTDAALVAGKHGWYVFDDGLHTSLGTLKGNIGSQNYRVPSDLDLTKYRSVTIWCARFDVSFGAAALVPA